MDKTLQPSSDSAEQGTPTSQEGGNAEAGQTTATVVQPVRKGAEKESVPGGTLMIAAYLVIWVALFVWLWMVRRTQVRLERDVQQLEERLDVHIGQTKGGARS